MKTHACQVLQAEDTVEVVATANVLATRVYTRDTDEGQTA